MATQSFKPRTHSPSLMRAWPTIYSRYEPGHSSVLYDLICEKHAVHSEVLNRTHRQLTEWSGIAELPFVPEEHEGIRP